MGKARRFNGGGGADKVDQAKYDSYDNSPEEAARKEEGLEATKGQSSGFFGLGRFLEGDIGNPKSEAYKYGAGYKSRKLAPVEDRTPVPVERPDSESSSSRNKAEMERMREDNPQARGGSDEEDRGVSSMMRERFASSSEEEGGGPPAASAKPPVNIVKTEVKKTVVPAKKSGTSQSTSPYRGEGKNSKAPASSEYNPEITPAERARRKKMESEQALETSTPEALIVGSGGIAAGAGLKGLFNLAKGAVSKFGARGGTKLNEYVQPLLSGSKETAKRLTGPEEAVADVVAKRLSVSRPAASDNVKEAARKLSERDQRAKNAKTRDVVSDRSSWSAGREGALGNKKGGRIKAYASGGSVSSASSRGDGIAQRGKTRGKMC